MKKFLGILMAIALVIGAAGTASAAFVRDGGDLAVVGFDSAEEWAINLTEGGSFNLADFDAAGSWADIQVGVFGAATDADFNSPTFGQKDFYFGVVPGASFGIIENNAIGMDGATQSLYELYNQNGNNVTQSASSYTAKMSPLGRYAGLLNATVGITDLGALDSGGSVVMDIYHLSSDNWGLAGSFTDNGVIGQVTFSADSVSFAPSAVPVPAAAWLLGSGLLGLIGIRRRNNA